jgi:hypothetical protein
VHPEIDEEGFSQDKDMEEGGMISLLTEYWNLPQSNNCSFENFWIVNNITNLQQ